jgi:hypothetical protein
LGGWTIPVGAANASVTLHAGRDAAGQRRPAKGQAPNLGLLVDQLAAAQTRMIEAEVDPFGPDDDEPGLPFCFLARDGLEFELVGERVA